MAEETDRILQAISNLHEGLARFSSSWANTKAVAAEAAANVRYVWRVQHPNYRGRYEQAMKDGKEWQHTAPDVAGKAPRVQLARPSGGVVDCTVTHQADACHVGCCRVWEATPNEPMELVVAAAPGDERNALVTGLGAGDQVLLRVYAMPPAAGSAR